MAQRPCLAPLRAATPAPAGGISAGFTLIELMVVLTILVMLLLVAGPLASDWINGARTHQGRAQLVQAYSQAKALALRNPCAIDGGTVVTFQASVEDGRIALQSLLEGDSSCVFRDDFANSDGVMPQQMLLPVGVALQLAGQPVTGSGPQQVTIDSRGMARGNSTFKLTQGGQQNDEEGALH